jgi:hypothetical protein
VAVQLPAKLLSGKARPDLQYIPLILKSSAVRFVRGLVDFHPIVVPFSCEYRGKHFYTSFLLSSSDTYQQ